eukprot:5442258-Amphidinium_carterae.1
MFQVIGILCCRSAKKIVLLLPSGLPTNLCNLFGHRANADALGCKSATGLDYGSPNKRCYVRSLLKVIVGTVQTSNVLEALVSEEIGDLYIEASKARTHTDKVW